MGYLANFMVYTLAMIGVIAVALLVFKNTNPFGGAGKSKFLKVLDSLTIAPRKTLYVVSTGREKFLIAGDVGNTTLISKLECVQTEEPEIPAVMSEESQDYSTRSFKDTITKLAKPSYMDKSNIGIKSSLLSQGRQGHSVLKNLAERIK